MAQRTIHYLLGEILIRDGIKDPDRFRIGNLLPDAYTGYENRFLTHFIRHKQASDHSWISYCDLESFFDRFRDRVCSDDLYLGYYMHLVEDACYRAFWKALGLQGKIRTDEDIRRLHRDYRLLNRYIVDRYDLKNETVLPDAFAMEAINCIYPFEVERLLEDLKTDFSDHTEGETCLLREKSLDAYISLYSEKCREILKTVTDTGKSIPSDFLTWPKVNYQFQK